LDGKQKNETFEFFELFGGMKIFAPKSRQCARYSTIGGFGEAAGSDRK
jgi:hypothetical protein